MEKEKFSIMSYGEIQVLFVIKPPYTQTEREQFFTWLRSHTSLDTQTCRQIALTGEQLPYLLLAAPSSGQGEDWDAQMKVLGVQTQLDTFRMTEEPLEAVYVTGRLSASGMSGFKRRWNELHPEDPISLSQLSKLRRGIDAMLLGTFPIRDTREREPIAQALESFGLTILAWIDIRDPWMD